MAPFQLAIVPLNMQKSEAVASCAEDLYQQLSYYERWIYAITQTLIQRGVISIDELGERIARAQAGDDAAD